jgi:TM2 domain-containing membrane protein YozV
MNEPSVQFHVPMKDTGVTYLLFFCLGGLGAHKFYLGRPAMGVLYIFFPVIFFSGLAVFVAQSWLNAAAAARGDASSHLFESIMLLCMAGGPVVALLYDLFTIPAQVRTENARIISEAQNTPGINPYTPSVRGSRNTSPVSAPLNWVDAHRAWVVVGVGVAVFFGVLVIFTFVGASKSSRLGSQSASAAVRPVEPANTQKSDCKVGLDQYQNLKTGMSYSQVIAILGCEGTELSRLEMAGIETMMVMWKGNSFAANMNVMLQNDALVSKAQFGLR